MKVYLVLETNFGTVGDYGSSSGLIWASLNKKKAKDFIDEKKEKLNEDGTIRFDCDIDEEDRDYSRRGYSRYDYRLLEYELEKEEYQYIDGLIE